MKWTRNFSICDQGLHADELSERSAWFVRTRWKAAGICLLVGLGGTAMPWLFTANFHVEPGIFFTVGLLLIFSNLVYADLAKRLMQHQSAKGGMCLFLSAQVVTDFMNLSFLSYGLGGVETPVVILFLPHIILSTLFFSRIYGFFMAWVGIFFAILPTLLEYFRMVPVVSIFDVTHKNAVISSHATVTAGFILAIAGGILICWYLVSDITYILLQRKHALQEAIRQLKILDQEKSQITMRATHELKAPFAAIKSYVYTLRDGYCGPLPEKARQVIQRMGERCDLLMEKITDIIHLSNLRTITKEQFIVTPTDLQAIVIQEVAEARLIGKLRRVRVHFQPQGLAVSIQGSKEHLATMISNLLRNAVNYSQEGGTVEVCLVEGGGKVSFEVTDHGIGIPNEHLNKIFTEHFRANNAVHFNPNGSGMGLALVMEIVRLHDATIDVVSQLGQGSCFTVTFAEEP
ncbi:MAG: HAMP domain-containing histidine kinase [Magnetococcus sp. THC-1_WYH]